MSATATPAFSSAVTWLAVEWKLIVLVLFAALSVLWIWWRTGSTHLLTTLLMRWLVGKRAAGSSPLVQFLQERTDLMHFRSVTGVRGVPTRAAAERLVEWTRQHDLDIDVVGRAGRYVDLHQLRLRSQPRLHWMAIAIVAGMSLWLVVAHLGNVAVLQPPLLRVIATDHWYALDGQNAQAFNWWAANGPVHQVSAAECVDRASVERSTGYPAYDVKVLCDLLLADGRLAKLAAVLRSQRIVAFIFCVPLMVWGWALLLWARGVAAARHLHQDMARGNASPRS